MCTLTVYRGADELRVTMNRDEARTRGPERAPDVYSTPNGIPWVGPLDSDSGGTWIGVNQGGVVACILNRYQDDHTYTPPRKAESRGRLVPQAMQFYGVSEGLDYYRQDNVDLSPYPPFTLVLADRNASFALDWRGHGALQQRELGRPWVLMTSSSIEPEAVQAWRQKAFDSWCQQGAPNTHGLADFHRYQPEDMAHYAPLMSRELSCTRSITSIRVSLSHMVPTLQHGLVMDSQLDWESYRLIHRPDTASSEIGRS